MVVAVMRRRGDKSAAMWFVTSMVVFVAVAVLAAWLWGVNVQCEQAALIREACLARRTLQVEHNRLEQVTRELIVTSAYTRRRLAGVADVGQEQAINLAAARKLEELADTLHQVPIGACK